MGEDERYAVRVSAAASIQFCELRLRAENSPNSTHAKLWNTVREIVRNRLPEQQVALSAAHALENKRHNFANIYSCGTGRQRIIYLASSKKRQVTILMMGFRKEGDSNDVYEQLHRRLSSGEFDTVFAELEVAKPSR